ncbi:hypothetical protein [Rhizobium mayense]|uniref:hypothetical protein n=1 Tax=Rhizobium mayense TaxID=1312184 RepID=UPI003D80A7C3
MANLLAAPVDTIEISFARLDILALRQHKSGDIEKIFNSLRAVFDREPLHGLAVLVKERAKLLLDLFPSQIASRIIQRGLYPRPDRGDPFFVFRFLPQPKPHCRAKDLARGGVSSGVDAALDCGHHFAWKCDTQFFIHVAFSNQAHIIGGIK